MEKKRKGERKKGKEKTKDSTLTRVAPPGYTGGTVMKDGSASSDGYEDLSGYEKEEEDKAMATPPLVAKKQTPNRQGANQIARQSPPTKHPPRSSRQSKPGPRQLLSMGYRVRDLWHK